jgi:Flp pilus assembly protein TadG
MHRPSLPPERRARRGSYNAVLGFLLPISIGLAALSVDTSWMRLSESQAQDVADAAAHAALIELRRTGSTSSARSAAEKVIAQNYVGEANGDLGDIEFGQWDRDSGGFDTSVSRPNAVRVGVGRYEDNPLNLHFATIWGKNSVEVGGRSTAATRSLNVVLVMDVTGSFSAEIGQARAAARAFLDILEDTHGKYDTIGMSIYSRNFGYEWTPPFELDDPAKLAAAKTQWGTLNVASKTTGGCPSSSAVSSNPWVLVEPRYVNFSTGGQFPSMMREYCDEPGTDHHVGMVMGRRMLVEQADPLAYRAMIILTDGDPNALGASPLARVNSGKDARAHMGYNETRWREYKGPVPHSRDAIIAATRTQATDAWEDEDTHVWMVSFRATHSYLPEIPKGDGKYYFTTNSSELTPIFEEIANSLPLLIVQ